MPLFNSWYELESYCNQGLYAARRAGRIDTSSIDLDRIIAEYVDDAKGWSDNARRPRHSLDSEGREQLLTWINEAIEANTRVINPGWVLSHRIPWVRAQAVAIIIRKAGTAPRYVAQLRREQARRDAEYEKTQRQVLEVGTRWRKRYNDEAQDPKYDVTILDFEEPQNKKQKGFVEYLKHNPDTYIPKDRTTPSHFKAHHVRLTKAETARRESGQLNLEGLFSGWRR